jgi:non-ribosomal peptide synthetase component E (peptide arylation enzyme)
MAIQKLTPEIIRTNIDYGAWQDHPLYHYIDIYANEAPDKLALADQHERLTYSQLAVRSSQLARGLLNLGLNEGDSVVVQSGNRVILAVAHIACDRANLCFVPISSSWRETEMRHLLSLSRARVALIPERSNNFDYLEAVRRMQARLPDLEVVVECGAENRGDMTLEDMLVGSTERVCHRKDPNSPLFVMVTSGTTDLPHLTRWTDNNLWFLLSQYADAVALDANDIIVGVAPANTGSTGYVFGVLAPLLHGASSVLQERWEARSAMELIAEEQATGVTAIPTQIIKMLQVESSAEASFTNLRFVSNGGSAMPPEKAAEMERRFGCKIQNIYGSSDGGVPVFGRVYDPDYKRTTTVGKILPHTEMRLLDGNLRDVPVGERGEIVWRSPTKSFGYLNEPEHTDATFWEKGWYRSGDLGEIDSDGYLRIVGRVKDMIIRGGQNISPREIEEAIFLHPGVLEVAVVGYPDPVFGERVCACVVLQPGQTLTLDALSKHLDNRSIAKFKLPERIEPFDELPRTAAEKISKLELREMVSARSPG